MKPPFYFAIVACLAVLLQACDQNTPAADPQPAGGGLLRIIKFKSPEYADFVVVEKTFNGDSCHIRQVHNIIIEVAIGSSPYIALPDDYYAVDWKWGQLIYPPTNFLIDVKWNEVTDSHQKWEYPSKYITSDIFKVWGYTAYKTIDSFLNIEVANPYDYTRPDWVDEKLPFHHYSDLPKAYKAEVRREDSLQNVYVERLSQIINEGNMKKVLRY